MNDIISLRNHIIIRSNFTNNLLFLMDKQKLIIGLTCKQKLIPIAKSRAGSEK